MGFFLFIGGNAFVKCLRISHTYSHIWRRVAQPERRRLLHTPRIDLWFCGFRLD